MQLLLFTLFFLSLGLKARGLSGLGWREWAGPRSLSSLWHSPSIRWMDASLKDEGVFLSFFTLHLFLSSVSASLFLWSPGVFSSSEANRSSVSPLC